MGEGSSTYKIMLVPVKCFKISLPCTGIEIYRLFHPRKPFVEIPAQDPESPHRTGECLCQKQMGGE